MKRTILILLSGLAVAAAGYCGAYYAEVPRCCCVAPGQSPELAWLRQEYHLDDAEFKRITELHEQYLGGCAERCRRIDLKNQEIARMLAATNTITPEIEKALAESALMRAQCQKIMLEHFYNVSRTMPAGEGQRYLAWIQSRTMSSDTHRGMGN